MAKTLIIAGGSSGIGFQLTQQLLEQGNHVINFSRTTPEISNALLQHHSIDFSNTELIFPEINQPIDGIVYFPGSIQLKPFKAFGKNDFISDFNLNVLGATELIKKYLLQLQQSHKPSIVLMSSVAVQTGMPFHSLVSASKGALEGLTKSLAAELAPKIRVNCVAPSLTATPLAEKFINNEEKLKASAERHPLKTIGDANDVASMINFLLSENAKFITGQILQIDGGMSSIKKI